MFEALLAFHRKRPPRCHEHMLGCHTLQQRWCMYHVGFSTRRQDQCLGLAASVHGGMQLGVESSLGATHCLLPLLSSGGVGTVAVDLDVGGVDHAEPHAAAPLHLLHGLIPESGLGPAVEVTVNRLPGNAEHVQRTPSAAFLEHEEHTCNDMLQIAEQAACTQGDR